MVSRLVRVQETSGSNPDTPIEKIREILKDLTDFSILLFEDVFSSTTYLPLAGQPYVSVTAFQENTERCTFIPTSRTFPSRIEYGKQSARLMIHYLWCPISIDHLACIGRVVLPVAKPPLELLALSGFRNIHVDFLGKMVYKFTRSNWLLKLCGELYPGTWQGQCFFFCIKDANLSSISHSNGFCDKILYRSFIHTGNRVDIHTRAIHIALGCVFPLRLNRTPPGVLFFCLSYIGGFSASPA